MTTHICITGPDSGYSCNFEIGRDHTRQERRDLIDSQLSKGAK